MHEAPISRIGEPIVAELPRRPILGPKAKRLAWSCAFAAADAVILLAAGAALLVFAAGLLNALPLID